MAASGPGKDTFFALYMNVFFESFPDFKKLPSESFQVLVASNRTIG